MQRLRPQSTDAPLGIDASLDQSRALQHTKVPRDGRKRDVERPGEIADRRLAASQASENSGPGRSASAANVPFNSAGTARGAPAFICHSFVTLYVIKLPDYYLTVKSDKESQAPAATHGPTRYHGHMGVPDIPDRDVAERFNLAQLPPDFYVDPYPTYRALRMHAPIKPMPDGSWFLTRFEDVVPVYRDPELFSSDKKKEFGPKSGPTPLFEHHTASLIFNDPPLHTRVRRAIVGAITQRHIAAMEPGLVRPVDALSTTWRAGGGRPHCRLRGGDSHRHYRQSARNRSR